MGDDKHGAPSCRNLPASPSIPAALDGLVFTNNFKIFSSSFFCYSGGGLDQWF